MVYLSALFALGFTASLFFYVLILKNLVSLGIFLTISGIFFIIFAFILLGIFSVNARVWATREYVITPETVMIVDASWGSKYRTHNLKGLTNIKLTQSLMAKKLNYGTITLYFMGGSFVNLTSIEDPINHLENVTSLVYKGYMPKGKE